MHSIEDVIDRGMCVGCGVCDVATGGKVFVELGKRGSFNARINGANEDDLIKAGQVCPFTDQSKNEDEISEQIFDPRMSYDEVIGFHSQIFAGRVNDDEYLQGSSSGGMTSWVASQLMSNGYVDAIIHVGPTNPDGNNIFGYKISTGIEEFTNRRKSIYYSTTLKDVLRDIRSQDKSFAVIGVPCFIRAVRLLAETDDEVGNRIKFYLGLVCGHLKSAWFAQSLAWQTGVEPHELETVDFRVKSSKRAANDYAFGAKSKFSDEILTKPTKELVGGNWGHGMFQLEACNYCDDIFAETADVVFGDAWIPEFQSDPRGTNVVISRNTIIDGLLRSGFSNGVLEGKHIDLQQARDSQAGNVRHRRLGLGVRLHDDLRRGLSVPVKRTSASITGVSRTRLRIVRFRRLLTKNSFESFEKALKKSDISIFLNTMRPMMIKYRLIDRGNLFGRIMNRLVSKSLLIVKRMLSAFKSRIKGSH